MTDLLAAAEERAALQRARVLPAAGCWCALLALAALASAWTVQPTSYGPSVDAGGASRYVAAVAGAVAAVLLGLAWLWPRRAGFASAAVLPAAVAALACWIGGAGNPDGAHAGPAPWLGGFGMITASAFALMAAGSAGSRWLTEVADSDEQSAISRVRLATDQADEPDET